MTYLDEAANEHRMRVHGDTFDLISLGTFVLRAVSDSITYLVEPDSLPVFEVSRFPVPVLTAVDPPHVWKACTAIHHQIFGLNRGSLVMFASDYLIVPMSQFKRDEVMKMLKSTISAYHVIIAATMEGCPIR